MKISVTLRDILDAPNIGAWDEFCTARGINPWCVNEGADDTSEYTITMEEAQNWGLIKYEENS